MKKLACPIPRRHFLALTAQAIAACSLPRRLFAASAESAVNSFRTAAATAKITTHKLRGNVSTLEGSGGNIAVLTGSDGKLLVDAGITASRRALSEALANISSDPVTHLINTHWHFDHTDGNEWLHSIGAKIIAHSNTKKHLSGIQRVEDWDYNFLPSPAGAIPSEVFEKEKQLKFNGQTIELKHYGPAHTDSDISVMFSEANVLHTGDTFWNGIYPFIDYSTGGSIDGTIKATEANLARVADDTIIIPGHGKPVSNKAELKECRDMLVAIRDEVANLKRQGKSRDETVAAKPTAPFDAKWGQFVIDGAYFTRLVYEGV